MGFEEVPHTADWSVRVWSQNLPGLLAESALAMNALAGVATGPGPRIKRSFKVEALDAEGLLVTFLSELIYYQEQEKLAFDQFDIRILDRDMSADIEGLPIVSVEKAIKAVTWHNLKIESTERGLEAEIVFDV